MPARNALITSRRACNFLFPTANDTKVLPDGAHWCPTAAPSQGQYKTSPRRNGISPWRENVLLVVCFQSNAYVDVRQLVLHNRTHSLQTRREECGYGKVISILYFISFPPHEWQLRARVENHRKNKLNFQHILVMENISNIHSNIM